MPKIRKTRKSVTKSRASQTSPVLKGIGKLHQAISTEREKLVKRYEKAIRASEKEVTRLSAQLAKIQKSKASSKPARGRKPAKNAGQKLEVALQAAKVELEQLTLGYKKLLGEAKALAAFEKEWKQSGTKHVKAARIKKPAKAGRKRKSAKVVTLESAEDTDASEETAIEMAS